VALLLWCAGRGNRLKNVSSGSDVAGKLKKITFLKVFRVHADQVTFPQVSTHSISISTHTTFRALRFLSAAVIVFHRPLTTASIADNALTRVMATGLGAVVKTVSARRCSAGRTARPNYIISRIDVTE